MELILHNPFAILPQILGFFEAYFEKNGVENFEKGGTFIADNLKEIWKSYEQVKHDEHIVNNKENKSENPLEMKEFFKRYSELNVKLEAFYKLYFIILTQAQKNAKCINSELISLIFNTKPHPKKEFKSLGYRSNVESE